MIIWGNTCLQRICVVTVLLVLRKKTNGVISPSVSVGWRFSDEKFMKFSKKFLEDGKIRVSYGITGNEAIGNYDYIYSYSPNSIYDGVGGVIPTRIGKDNLKWEETKQFNLGLDLNFWNSRLTNHCRLLR